MIKIYLKGTTVVIDNGVDQLKTIPAGKTSFQFIEDRVILNDSTNLKSYNYLISDVQNEAETLSGLEADLLDYLAEFIGLGFNTTSGGSEVVSGRIIAMTQISNSSLIHHTIPAGANFTAINLNSGGSSRFAKITFIAPENGKVLLSMLFDMVVSNSASHVMIGLNNSSSNTTTPSEGWYRINADNDGTSGQFYAEFLKIDLTPGNTYTYYFMAVSDYSASMIRASSQQLGIYSSGADLPSPLRITAYDLADISIVTNPTT